jgi:hypothetical protein
MFFLRDKKKQKWDHRALGDISSLLKKKTGRYLAALSGIYIYYLGDILQPFREYIYISSIIPLVFPARQKTKVLVTGP